MENSASSPSSLLNKENLLYQLLKKEHGYYKAIFEITQEENETLKTHQSITELKPLLKKKKILLACINEIESAMTPLKKYWQSKINRSDEPSEKIKLELNALNQLLKEILQLDLLSQKTMENHLLYLRERNTVLSQNPRNDKPSTLNG
jgi:hypothetical protein